MQGRTIESILGLSDPENLRKSKIVIKSGLQEASGKMYPIPSYIRPRLDYILLQRDVLNDSIGPDLILTVYKETGSYANVYGGEWNDGIY